MAYVNVAEWSPDQTSDWLKGVDKSVEAYASVFLSSQVYGHQLLGFRADDLENLNICSIGHQELILEAVSQLRNFHYELDRENLQYLALKLSSAATSLYNELRQYENTSKVETQTLSDVTYIIGMVKPLALWLDRSPFSGQNDYTSKKLELLKLSLNMVTMALRGNFAVKPLEAVRESCIKLADIANTIIQEISDPMILQPATLDLVTLKKRENELGFDILPSFNGIHQVINIKLGSPAHTSGKIENGDEIVQVNYQTVVGWQPKEILSLCQESPIDILLTLKKRPRHTHTYGQIYIKPYRLPSRKRTPYNKWGSLPSPRPELLSICNFEITLPPSPTINPPPSDAETNLSIDQEGNSSLDIEDNSSSDENDMLSPPGSPNALSHVSSQKRIFMPKPRSVVQRRNTISGSSPMLKHPNTSIEQLWRELKNHKSLQHSGSAQITNVNDDDISDNLCHRDKSVSCSTGLELSPRPKTCLGVGITHPKITNMSKKMNNTDTKNIKTVKFQDQLIITNTSNESETSHDKDLPSRERGRLDKSFSTPAYDFGDTEDNEFSLVKEIIPESPTSVDSPSIVIHSPEKIEQILGFKKSSEQISDAMNQQQKDKNDLVDILEVNMDTSDFSKKINKFIEVYNPVLLENKCDPLYGAKVKFEGKSFNPDQSIDLIADKSLGSNNEQTIIIEKNPIENTNEQTKFIPKNMDLLIHSSKLDLPPEPPPRPLSTQKHNYVPLKPKNIQKEDIHVIPNPDIINTLSPLRKDLSSINNPSHPNDILYDKNKSFNSLSLTELSNSISSQINSKNLPKLEPPTSHSNMNKLETSIIDLKCNTLNGPKLSLSPPNSMARNKHSIGKSKNLKKKNSILAKRRKVSVKDLGASDMEGYLYQRCRTKNNSNANWQLRWYILIDNTFYGFKRKDSIKAECLIFLSGFTVSVAQEVKSKPFAFKVYHTGTAFYFACESAESMAIWVENITRATLPNNDSWERASKKDKKTDESKHYSETDYSDEDFTAETQTHFTNSQSSKSKKADKQEKSEKSYKFGSLKKFTNRMNKSDSSENVSHSSSLDRKYLRFFSSKSKNKEEKSKPKSSDVPVPTDQYRSYRKIPTTTITPPSSDDTNQIHKRSESSKEGTEKLPQYIAKIKKIESIDTGNFKETENSSNVSVKHMKKPIPKDYIHASNPNLLEFDISNFVSKPKNNLSFLKDFQVPRSDNIIGFITLEQFMLKEQEEERRQKYSNRVLMGVERDARREDKNNRLKQDNSSRDDLTGFITLKQLMLNKQEEERRQMYSNKVYMGVEKNDKNYHLKESSSRDDNLLRQLDEIIPDVIYGEIPTYMDKIKSPLKIEQIQNRSLPKTPDENLKSDDLYNTRDKFYLNEKITSQVKKKNDGYETIKYDEIHDFIKNIENKSSNDVKEHKFNIKSNINAIDNAKSSILPIKPKVPKRIEDNKNFKHENENLNSSILINTIESNWSSKSSDIAKDLGYETIYGDDIEDSNQLYSSSSSTNTINDIKSKKPFIDGRKPTPPPKLSKNKPLINRQCSLTSIGERKSTGIDERPVFKQGDSPEKFWLDSLRRNDKVYSSKGNENSSSVIKSDKFYTKHTEPSTYMKSSEATIVKSDKMQKSLISSENDTRVIEHKPLKSATQYTPISLPIVSPNKSLKTSPKFELSLDSRDTSSPVSSISRLRQIFQHNNTSSKNASTLSPTLSTSKEKTLLGSPRLHRAIFRKNHGSTAADEWTKDFSYSKLPPVTIQPDNVSDSFLFMDTHNDPGLSLTNYDTLASNITAPDYPHLEYPPVFEPETYSLANPGPSILKKINLDSNKK